MSSTYDDQPQKTTLRVILFLQRREPVHGRDLQPDYMLRGTYNNDAHIACTTRPSVLLSGNRLGPEVLLSKTKPQGFGSITRFRTRIVPFIDWHGLIARPLPATARPWSANSPYRQIITLIMSYIQRSERPEHIPTMRIFCFSRCQELGR